MTRECGRCFTDMADAKEYSGMLLCNRCYCEILCNTANIEEKHAYSDLEWDDFCRYMQKQQDDILSALRYGEELTWLLDGFVKEQRERFAEWLEDYRGDHTRDDRVSQGQDNTPRFSSKRQSSLQGMRVV